MNIYFCKEPQCRQPCVFTSSQLTCMTCGLEQDVPDAAKSKISKISLIARIE